MNKIEIETLIYDKTTNNKNKLDILQQEYYDAIFQTGYHKEKANYLEMEINKLKGE